MHSLADLIYTISEKEPTLFLQSPVKDVNFFLEVHNTFMKSSLGVIVTIILFNYHADL